MLLDNKDLEIAAISTSIAAGCIPCARYHIKEAGNQSATDAEIAQGIKIGTTVSRISAAELERLFDGGPDHDVERTVIEKSERIVILAALGAALARNSVSLFRELKKAAAAVGVEDTEIMEIVGLAKRIGERAASHIDPLVAKPDGDPTLATAAAGLCT